MGRFCFPRALLLLALLLLSLFFSRSHGFGRKVMETFEFGDSSLQVEETAGNSRKMVELLDYRLDPEPNTNPKTGYIYSPPPQGKS